MTAPIQDHRAESKPQQRSRWSWAFMRRDTYDGPGREWTRNRFLIGKPGNPMMQRWRLIQTPLFGIYVHFIYREDLDPVPHDHPWRWSVGSCGRGASTKWVASWTGGTRSAFAPLRARVAPASTRRHRHDRPHLRSPHHCCFRCSGLVCFYLHNERESLTWTTR